MNEHNENDMCKCGQRYGDHYSDLQGDNWCPEAESRELTAQKFCLAEQRST